MNCLTPTDPMRNPKCGCDSCIDRYVKVRPDSYIYRVGEIKMAKVFEYVVVLNPSKDEADKGGLPQVISGIRSLVAANDAEVRVRAIAELVPTSSKMTDSDWARVEVLVRPFV